MSQPQQPTVASESHTPRVRAAAAFPGGVVLLWTLSLCGALVWSLLPELTQAESGAAFYRQPESGQPTRSFELVARTAAVFVAAVWPLLLLRRGTWQPAVSPSASAASEPRTAVRESVPPPLAPAPVAPPATPLDDLFAEPHPEVPTVEPEGSAGHLRAIASESLIMPSASAQPKPTPASPAVAAAAPTQAAAASPDDPIPLEPPSETPAVIKHSAEPVAAIANKLPETKLPDTKLPDTKLPDTKLPETRLPESKPNSTNPTQAAEGAGAEPPSANVWAGLLPPAEAGSVGSSTPAARPMAELVPPLTLAPLTLSPSAPQSQPNRAPPMSLVRGVPTKAVAAPERPVTGGKALLHLLAMAVSAVPIFALSVWLSDAGTARLLEVVAVLLSYGSLHSGYAAATGGWTRWAPDRLYSVAVLGVVLFWPWAAAWCAEFSAPAEVRELANLAHASWHPQRLAELVVYEGLPVTEALRSGALAEASSDSVSGLTADPVHRALLFPAGIGLMLWLISPLTGRRV